jgi:hypothetical protein
MSPEVRFDLLVGARSSEDRTQLGSQVLHYTVQPLPLQLVALGIEEVEAETDAFVADSGLATHHTRDPEYLQARLAAERTHLPAIRSTICLGNSINPIDVSTSPAVVAPQSHKKRRRVGTAG